MVAQALRERNLLRVSLTAFLLLAGAVIIWRWVKGIPGQRDIGPVIGLTVAILWALARGLTPEERTHLIEYTIVTALIHGALIERRRHDSRVPAPAALALLMALALGWIDEGIQALLPNRFYDIEDVVFNAIAALMAIAVALAVTHMRKRYGNPIEPER